MACVTPRVFPDPEPPNLVTLWFNTPPEQRDEQFWRPSQVAYKLGVSETHIRNLADHGKLAGAIKPCGRWFIHLPTLIASMESNN